MIAVLPTDAYKAIVGDTVTDAETKQIVDNTWVELVNVQTGEVLKGETGSDAGYVYFNAIPVGEYRPQLTQEALDAGFIQVVPEGHESTLNVNEGPSEVFASSVAIRFEKATEETTTTTPEETTTTTPEETSTTTQEETTTTTTTPVQEVGEVRISAMANPDYRAIVGDAVATEEAQYLVDNLMIELVNIDTGEIIQGVSGQFRRYVYFYDVPVGNYRPQLSEAALAEGYIQAVPDGFNSEIEVKDNIVSSMATWFKKEVTPEETTTTAPEETTTTVPEETTTVPEETTIPEETTAPSDTEPTTTPVQYGSAQLNFKPSDEYISKVGLERAENERKYLVDNNLLVLVNADKEEFTGTAGSTEADKYILTFSNVPVGEYEVVLKNPQGDESYKLTNTGIKITVTAEQAGGGGVRFQSVFAIEIPSIEFERTMGTAQVNPLPNDEYKASTTNDVVAERTEIISNKYIQLKNVVTGETYQPDATTGADGERLYFFNIPVGKYDPELNQAGLDAGYIEKPHADGETTIDVAEDATISIALRFARDISPEETTTTTPVEETTTTTPVEETTTPVDETTAPVEETTAPVDETTATSGDYDTVTTPVDETTAPVDETTATSGDDDTVTTPVEETTTPVEETTAPVEETTAPVEETTATSGNDDTVTTPVEETTTPVEETTTPVGETSATIGDDDSSTDTTDKDTKATTEKSVADDTKSVDKTTTTKASDKKENAAKTGEESLLPIVALLAVSAAAAYVIRRKKYSEQ